MTCKEIVSLYFGHGFSHPIKYFSDENCSPSQNKFRRFETNHLVCNLRTLHKFKITITCFSDCVKVLTLYRWARLSCEIYQKYILMYGIIQLTPPPLKNECDTDPRPLPPAHTPGFSKNCFARVGVTEL